MNIKLKQVISILTLSIILSFFRYFLLEDYNLIKKKRIDINNSSNNLTNIDSLKNYVNSTISPQMIDLRVVKLLYDNNLVTFLDARDVESYNVKHIMGSINLPYENIDSIVNEYDLIYYLTELVNEDFKEVIKIEDNESFIIGLDNSNIFIKSGSNLNEPIKKNEMAFVIYCSGEGCSLSEDLGLYLFEIMQIKKIFIYEGGMPEWIEKKYPIE